MQQNYPTPAFSLLLAFALRWVASSLLGWVMGFVIILVILFIVGIYFGMIGLGQDEIMAKAETLTLVVAVPVFIGVIPFISAVIAFFWTLSSDQAKAYMAGPAAGLHQQPQYGAFQAGQQAPVHAGDANAQYAAAYQKWQQEYAEYQRRVASGQAVQPPPQTRGESESDSR